FIGLSIHPSTRSLLEFARTHTRVLSVHGHAEPMLSCFWRPLRAGSWVVSGSPRGAEACTSAAACTRAPLRPSASVPASLAHSCRAQRRRLVERDQRQGVHSALSIYDADANAHLSILLARISKELELGMEVEMETERCTQMVDWNMEMENEIEMDTAHSHISVEISAGAPTVPIPPCAREVDVETGQAVAAAPAYTCRWFLRMRMETEVQRVWTYVLPTPALSSPSAPSSPSSSAASFGFILKALRYCMHTWARACTMDVDVGVVLPRFARGIRLTDAEKRMRTCRLAGYDSVRTSVEVGMKIPMFVLAPHLHPPPPPALRYHSPAYLSISYRVYVSVPSTCATTEDKLGPFVHLWMLKQSSSLLRLLAFGAVLSSGSPNLQSSVSFVRVGLRL
ncbi:hypothetical protein B0H13DRAFT_2444808, partial [Mycena leptocephala]